MPYLMTSLITLILITVTPCILWPLPKEDIPVLLNPKQFFAATNDFSNKTNLSAEDTEKSNQRDHEFSINIKKLEGDIHASDSVLHQHRDLRAKQSGQNYFLNSQHDNSDLSHLLWRQVLGDNLNSRLSKSGSKLSSFNPRVGIHGNTLPSQETAQLDPIYMFDKPAETAYNRPVEKVEPNEEASRPAPPLFGNNFFVDLLPNQQSPFTGLNNDLSIFQQRLPNVGSIFHSYLTGFASSIRRTYSFSENDCSLIVENLPLLLINAFVNALNTIGKLELPEILTIPFVALNVLNFITSFLFLNEYCSHGSN